MKKKVKMNSIAERLVKREKFWALMEKYKKIDKSSLECSIAEHMEFDQAKEKFTADDVDFYMSLAYAVREHLTERLNDTMHHHYWENVKRVYYISMEYLMGRMLSNALINLDIYDLVKETLDDFGLDLEELLEYEPDAGLGNGGLGRLAACFLDSLATMGIPAVGYGLRYDYGIFQQTIKDGFQVEQPDNWLKYGYPWELLRRDRTFEISAYGRVNQYTDVNGALRNEWGHAKRALALAYDIPIPGYCNNTVNFLRLWHAKATNEFDLYDFNKGNYFKAVEQKAMTETISKILYPKDDIVEGKELRLIQEYFLVSATLQDIVRRHRVKNPTLENLADKAAIQLNDTHPTLAVAELMRILVDLEHLGWEKSWDIVEKTIAYTNHTVLPEALEKWPVDLMEHVLPRHLQIIYEINRRHLDKVQERFPGDIGRLQRMSIIDEGPPKQVRMASLAVVGSHSINGVAELHSKIIRETMFKDFTELWPHKFNNKTNGITQRRWLLQCNPDLADLITKQIGDKWVTNLDELKKLRPLADDKKFQNAWWQVKLRNKKRLADYIKRTLDIDVNLDSIFDCQAKRIHEYKRQLLNVLHVISFYNWIKQHPGAHMTPRTVIFSGKAAPGYVMAKLIIKLINSVAEVVNNDPDVGNLLKVIFLENYGVSLAEILIPAADLSEQISTAGMEASGTGNMKFSMNGALTIGTLDGANIEIMEEVGRENIFIFGLNAQEVSQLRQAGYNPYEEVHRNQQISQCLEMIANGTFSNGDEELFKPILDYLLVQGDFFLVLKDFEAYVRCQQEVSKRYQDHCDWARMSILNCCNIGKFSSDRTIREYATQIWNAVPVKISKQRKTPSVKVPS